MELWKELFPKYSVTEKKQHKTWLSPSLPPGIDPQTLVSYGVWTDLSFLSGLRISVGSPWYCHHACMTFVHSVAIMSKFWTFNYQFQDLSHCLDNTAKFILKCTEVTPLIYINLNTFKSVFSLFYIYYILLSNFFNTTYLYIYVNSKKKTTTKTFLYKFFIDNIEVHQLFMWS